MTLCHSKIFVINIIHKTSFIYLTTLSLIFDSILALLDTSTQVLIHCKLNFGLSNFSRSDVPSLPPTPIFFIVHVSGTPSFYHYTGLRLSFTDLNPSSSSHVLLFLPFLTHTSAVVPSRVPLRPLRIPKLRVVTLPFGNLLKSVPSLSWTKYKIF